MEFFQEGGYMMWVISAAALFVVVFAAQSVRRLIGMGGVAGAARATTHADAVLFWGAFALAAGFLGTAVGLYQAAGALEAAGQVDASLAWGGLRVTLVTTQFGLLVFLTALLLWFGLWFTARRTTTSAA
jgi:MotA/TolQ/ExbB proton channel family